MIKTHYPTEFTLLETISARYGETKDCTVKAFSVVTGFSYEESHAAMARAGRKRRKGLQSNFSSFNDRMLLELEKCGFTCKRINCNSKTVRTLGRNIKSNAAFLVFVRGHVLAIKDKKVIDWTDGRCHRIKSVWKVEKR